MSARHAAWLLLLALSACAQLPMGTDAPVCDGRHRRPANPYGSVLTVASPSITPSSPQAEPSVAGPQGFASCP